MVFLAITNIQGPFSDAGSAAINRCSIHALDTSNAPASATEPICYRKAAIGVILAVRGLVNRAGFGDAA